MGGSTSSEKLYVYLSFPLIVTDFLSLHLLLCARLRNIKNCSDKKNSILAHCGLSSSTHPLYNSKLDRISNYYVGHVEIMLF
jgi:hypothetical protein